MGSASAADQLALVQRAEALGYDSVWVGEAWGPEVFTTLTWLACNTSHIKLGAGIANVFSRTPALLAQTAATLDSISGGRLLLGLGTSGQAVIERWHGVPFEQGPQRLREYADIVRLALSGERVNYDGQIFKLSGFRLAATPVRTSIPIYFASITPAGFRATGECADGWLPIWMTTAHLAECRSRIDAAGTGAGRSASAIHTAIELHSGVSDGPEVRELARAHLARYIGGMGVFYHGLVCAQGFATEADMIKETYGKDRTAAARLVSDEMLDELTVAGTAEHCRRRIETYRQAGADLPVLNLVDGLSPAQIGETLEALAPRRD
jgi:F420-dependent oxidoreductase-like protein